MYTELVHILYFILKSMHQKVDYFGPFLTTMLLYKTSTKWSSYLCDFQTGGGLGCSRGHGMGHDVTDFSRFPSDVFPGDSPAQKLKVFSVQTQAVKLK